jgi:leucyl aminopeptidase
MQATIKITKSIPEKISQVIFLNPTNSLNQFISDKLPLAYVESKIENKQEVITLNLYDKFLFFLPEIKEDSLYKKKEILRKKAFEISQILHKEAISDLNINANSLQHQEVLAFCEGLLLSGYNFDKYKTSPKEYFLENIYIQHDSLTQQEVDELQNLVKGTCIARDLVNEPVIHLDAEQLAEEIEKIGKESGFSVEVLNELKIKSLKMGGLLAVNQGSLIPPTFSILEYKPKNAVNNKPYILIGKGVVYDTGGLSLKPTPNSMDMMKCDMAGAAAVVGAFVALSKNKLPIHVIGLIPATDNRPGGNAITPGDVITMYDGTTVEVLNTDAEGRLLLADALGYAKKYDPELVIDLATLTGAAVAAVGKEGMVMMGNAKQEYKNLLQEAGLQVYERMVEFPLWEEYKAYIESDIADIKNLGGNTAGAITAGIFLQHFIDYNWVHLDIAGTAFIKTQESYKGKNGTGSGVRLIYQFLKTLTQNG